MRCSRRHGRSIAPARVSRVAIQWTADQVVRLVVPDGAGVIKMQGTVAWAIAVPSGNSIQYRAGIEFVNPNKQQLADFCERHGAAPDPTTHERRRGDSSIRASRSQGPS
jgi:hypothetical protein